MFCKKCGNIFDLVYDHIIPRSIGVIYLNLTKGELDRENCQYLCRSCNSRKGMNEDKVLFNKFKNIKHLYNDLMSIKSNKRTPDNIDKKAMLEFKNIPIEDLYQHMAFQNGRLRVSQEDVEKIEKILYWINFKLREM